MVSSLRHLLLSIENSGETRIFIFVLPYRGADFGMDETSSRAVYLRMT